MSEELSFIGPQDLASTAADASRTVPPKPALNVLELPIHDVLTQTLSLPERLRRHLDQAIEHNLSQWSPFSADEVLVAHRAGQTSGPTFDLDLRYVLRSQVQPIIDTLAARGIPLTAVALGDRAWLSVIDKATTDALIRRRQRVRLLSLTAVLLFFCLWLVINWRQEAELQRLQQSRFQTISQLRQIGDEIAQLRKFQDARRFVTDQADRTLGDVVLLLAETLPPSVAPRALTVERGALRLVVPSDLAETARVALVGKAGIEKVAIERGSQDQATITAVLVSAKPQ
ncbi:hypothetical protein ACWIGM_15575 [Bosea sp. NPDC055332]